MTAFLTVPVQSQTPLPTVPPRLTNPTVMAPCGLPASYAEFTADATVTTFNMTADCVFNSWSVQDGLAFLYFSSGEFTINGNGHSIIGPSNGWTLFVENAGTVLNLNQVTIRQNGANNAISVEGARLNARNVIFRDNTNAITILFVFSSEVHLRNVQFLSNRVTGATNPLVRSDGAGSLIVITNGIFRGNIVSGSDMLTVSNNGAARLEGCIISENNFQTDGVTPANSFRATDSGSDFQDNRGRCPKRKKEEKVPTATPTPRPLAVTCPALSQFGIAIHATYGLASGVQCQRLDGGGIGIQSIIDAGFIEAVDIWGYVEQGVEVCFPQAGRLLFLDARTMPRSIAPLESTVVNGMTCASIASPGSLVLMPN